MDQQTKKSWGEVVKERWETFHQISGQPLVRAFLVVWALSGIWDLVLSEWIPEKYARHLPRLYQVIGMITGIVPWVVWILVGAAICVFVSLEFAVRRQRTAPNGYEQKIQKPRSSKRFYLLTGAVAVGIAACYILSGLYLISHDHHATKTPVARAIPPKNAPETPKESSSDPAEGSTSERAPIAAARLLYDSETNQLTALDHEGIATVIIEAQSSLMIDNGPLVIKFGFTPGEEGPFDIDIQTSQADDGFGEQYKVLENTGRYVSILAFRNSTIGIVISHEVNIKFFRK